MRTLSVLTWLGNAAAVLLGRPGAITDHANQAGCSRQAAYEHAHKVEQAIADAQQPGPSRGELLEENHRLQQQLTDLQQRTRDTILFGKERQQRLVATASAQGLSRAQIVELFAVLLPADRVPDRSTFGRWVLQHARRAAAILQILDRFSCPLAAVLCLDEIFFHGRPVLVAVEPASMAVLLCQRTADRQGTTWRDALLPFTHLQAVVRDAGSGLAAGVALLNEQRQQRPGSSPLEDGLDLFHTEQEAQRWLNRLWRRVERRWHAAEEAEQKVIQAKQRQADARGPAARARSAWHGAFHLFAWYEREEALWRRARTALELFCPDGSLNDATRARAELADVCRQLPGVAWAKVRSYLEDRRMLTFLERTHRLLNEAEPDAVRRAARVELWRLEHRGSANDISLAVVQPVICGKLVPDWETAYGRVGEVLGGVVRASSAVECVNSVLRMQQARHRTVTQPMLDLKRLYWNCRSFRAGKRRDHCPYQHLKLALPTYDFWELLYTDPQKLAEQLSTQAVAA